MAEIKIKQINYKGWVKAVELSNSLIKLIVVPETGRIHFLSFIDGENIFYENEELNGVSFKNDEYYIEKGEKKSPNIGGNRVLPCSEDYFHLLTDSRHIPDPYINASQYSFTLLDNGIILKSPISKLLGIQITRKITISEESSTIKIAQEIVKLKQANKKELEQIPLTIWSLSKIKTPNVSYTGISKNSIFKNGFIISKWPDAKNYAEDNVSVINNILALKSTEKHPQKIGIDSKKWVAGYLNNTLFVEEFIFDNEETYPDNGTSVTIFGNHLFTELECLSPERVLKIGESIHYNLSWNLHNVKDKTHLKELLTYL